jgi:uncharacterized membrane protein
MSQTTFSGPVKSNNGFLFPTTTTAILGAASNEINTQNKSAGVAVFNTTDNLIYVAVGSNATSDWQPSDGGTAITPA